MLQRHNARVLEAGLRSEVDVLLLAASAARRGNGAALQDYQFSAARVAALLLALGAELEHARTEPPGALVRRLALVP